jgi:hypothetical protein
VKMPVFGCYLNQTDFESIPQPPHKKIKLEIFAFRVLHKDEKASRQHFESATDNNRLSMKVKRKLN